MPSNNDDNSTQPLLPSSPYPSFTAGTTSDAADPPSTSIPDPDSSSFKTHPLAHSRQKLQSFLSSRAQHFTVLGLVSLDLLGIFSDIFINLYTCEEGEPSPHWDAIRRGLDIAGLVFSSLFMLELLLSIWAFGWRYFTSSFHIFDSVVIVTGFIVDVLLHGILEEIASLVIVLRLWRFFKIIEEFSVGAQEQMDGLELRIESLEMENQELRSRLRLAKGSDEEAEVGMRERSR